MIIIEKVSRHDFEIIPRGVRKRAASIAVSGSAGRPASVELRCRSAWQQFSLFA
jgi:hypothetical protein